MSTDETLISGRYRVSGKIGRGSFTDVYKAEDVALGRKVALKVLAAEHCDDERIVARFSQEARMATNLVHDHIGRVYDVGRARFSDAPERERPYLVMERVPGLPLTRLVERGPLRAAEAERLAAEILDALEYAHRTGIVHRDVKPSNVMVSTSGSIKVVDFGIAAALTEAGDRVFHGEADYAAPEARSGQRQDARSDLYSVGVLLFHMLTGEVPLPGGYSGVRAVAASSINERVPVALNIVVARALEPVPASRYQSATDFRADLATAESGVVPPTSSVPDVREALLGVPTVATVSAAEGALAVTPQTGGTGRTLTAGEANLPETQALTHVLTDESVPSTETDELVTMFGRSAVSTNQEFSPSLPANSRQRGRVALGLVVSLVFVVVISMVTMWVLNIKPVDFFPSSARSVPNVVGFTYAKAVDALKKEGLTVVREDEPSLTIPKEAVIRTNPSANKKVDIGTRVTLVVSSGVSQVEVPDISGMTVDMATNELTKAGFKTGTTSEGNSATIAKGLVLGTTPEKGTMVQAGSTINLVLSNGLVNIPDLTGKTIDEATSILSSGAIMMTPILQADRGCKASPSGITVSSQSIPPGDVPVGTPITLGYCAG